MYELLLSNHDKKCLTCARNQDCEFQALGRELGVEESPYEGRDLRPIDVSESLTRDPNKCILCRRCVSVCNKIQTTSILTAENRGFQTVITPAFWASHWQHSLYLLRSVRRGLPGRRSEGDQP